MWAAAREKVFCQKFVCHGGVRMRRKHNGNKSWLCCPNARLRADGRVGGGGAGGCCGGRVTCTPSPCISTLRLSFPLHSQSKFPSVVPLLSFRLSSPSASPLFLPLLSFRLSSPPASPLFLPLLPSSLPHTTQASRVDEPSFANEREATPAASAIHPLSCIAAHPSPLSLLPLLSPAISSFPLFSPVWGPRDRDRTRRHAATGVALTRLARSIARLVAVIICVEASGDRFRVRVWRWPKEAGAGRLYGRRGMWALGQRRSRGSRWPGWGCGRVRGRIVILGMRI